MDRKNYHWGKTREISCSVLVLSMGSKHITVNTQNKAACCSSLPHTIPVTRLSKISMNILERFPKKMFYSIERIFICGHILLYARLCGRHCRGFENSPLPANSFILYYRYKIIQGRMRINIYRSYL